MARACFVLLVVSVLASGCGNSRAQSSEELDRARSSLQAALDAWKNKETPKKLQARSPAIQISDPDWNAGTRLLDFEIQRTEGDKDKATRCHARLSLQDRAGKKSDKDVVFDVRASSSEVVIGRDPFY